MKRMNHTTPIGIVFKQHNIKYQVVEASVNLDEVYRMDADSIGKPYYQLRGTFTCESCGEDTERQVLHIYYKVQKEKMPYVLCDSCIHQSFVHTSRLAANKRWKETGFMRLVDRLDDLGEYWDYEKNTLNLDEIMLKDVTGKEGRYQYTSVHLYCYLCEGECERSLRTIMNNKSNTGHSWVLCDECKRVSNF